LTRDKVPVHFRTSSIKTSFTAPVWVFFVRNRLREITL